ncbi:flagellar basal body rod protein FlgB [Buchnera aphidicola (Ceratovacuna keduensis)]|uniref:flagellar basal body rod protein FlgB n=1 Tax=Buchnera aphidicola TaxID=9 RepID=UPI0031B8062A
MIKIINDFFELNKMLLNLRALKEESIASNIANCKTPNYNKRNIQFEEIVKKIDSIKKKRELYATCSRHITKSSKTISLKDYMKILEKRKSFKKINKIDLNREKMKFLKNSLSYQLEISAISKKIRNIYLAIQG